MDTKAGTAQTTTSNRESARPSVANEQTWTLLQYFNYYRLGIAALVVVIGAVFDSWPPYGEANPALFFYSGLTYLVIAGFAYAIIRSRVPDAQTQGSVFAFADVTFLTLLIHSSGGLDSGLGLLLLIAVAGTSLILGRRMTVFFAALAAIAVILEQGWDLFTGVDGAASAVIEGFPQAGMLGVGLFVTSGLGYSLANRLRDTEALAKRRGADLLNLAHINELIIQRMMMGVLLCDVNGNIGLINERACTFLGLPKGKRARPNLSTLSPELAEALSQWTDNPGSGPLRRPFRTKTGYQVVPRFVLLRTDRAASGILIFMSDTALLRQQAQQLKMAALARLTASIAHEIRNPLGAISNAAQLLAESTDRDSDDQRLVQIIEDHTRRMNVIIENITQLSRRDRLSQTRLNLRQWLQDFATQFADLSHLSAGAVTVEGDDGTGTCVDPDQLYQIVINLCQNALRHCPEYAGAEALIHLEVGSSDDGRPVIDVKDRGSGVPPEIEENIFDPFFTTTPQGTGLGLYIARELAEGNGGELDYVSGSPIGAHFRVTLARPEECTEFAET